ncbi:hypothetical protein ACFLWR_05225 [Chloroflexota bacterium]
MKRFLIALTLALILMLTVGTSVAYADDAIYSVTISPASLEVEPGDAAIYSGDVNCLLDMAMRTDLELTGAPDGSEILFYREGGIWQPHYPYTLTIIVPEEAAPGNYDIAVSVTWWEPDGVDKIIVAQASTSAELVVLDSTVVPTELSIIPSEIHAHLTFTLLGTGYTPGQTVYWGVYVYDNGGNQLQGIGWGNSIVDADGNAEELVEGGIASLLSGIPPQNVGSVKFEAGVPGMGKTYLQVNLLPYQPPAIIGNLINHIDSLLIPSGLKNSLISTLENVEKSIENGNDKTALNQLNAFINKVEAQKGKIISDGDADTIIYQALLIISKIQGGPPPDDGL